MHLSMEQITDLSWAYLHNSILNDEQLSCKIHMSECDECYENFCACLGVLKVMTDRGLADKEPANEGLTDEELTDKRLTNSELTDSELISHNNVKYKVKMGWMNNENMSDVDMHNEGLSLENDRKEISQHSKSICLEINIYNKELKFVNKLEGESEEKAAYWNFVKRPQLALGRSEHSDNDGIKKEEIYESPVSEYSHISRKNGKINITLDGDKYETGKLAVKYISNEAEQIKEFEYDEEYEVYSVVIDEKLVEKGKIEIFYQ